MNEAQRPYNHATFGNCTNKVFMGYWWAVVIRATCLTASTSRLTNSSRPRDVNFQGTVRTIRR